MNVCFGVSLVYLVFVLPYFASKAGTANDINLYAIGRVWGFPIAVLGLVVSGIYLLVGCVGG